MLAGGVVTLPLAPSVGAMHGKGSYHGSSQHHDNGSYILKEESNASYTVKTIMHPRSHMLSSIVTNKTANTISPTVTFNGQNVTAFENKSIEPGESQKYVYYFTGNNKSVAVTVVTPDIDPFTSTVDVALPEPITFTATSTDTANKTVTGSLTNNTAESQTVYINHHKHKKYNQTPITETLAPNETRTITVAAPSHGDKKKDNHYDQGYEQIRISLATQAGFKSKYKVLLIPPVSGYPF